MVTVAPEKTIKPPLKWAGGKRWLVSHLAPIWKRYSTRRYVEPFCGGLAVALGLQPKRALLNDVNPHLINFYRHRERFNQLIQNGGAKSSEAAELFYYLNRTCFNGLCRFNKSGEFNVPFGTYSTVNYDADFSTYPAVLRDWKFTNADVEKVPVQKGDFVYADPPYDVEFTTYSAGGFSWDDQERAAAFLARHDGPVVISNQETPRIVELYERLGFALSCLPGPRRISCTGDRTAAREVLAVKE